MNHDASARSRVLRRSIATSALTQGMGFAVLLGLGAGAAQAQQALPTGGTVASGSATITPGAANVAVSQSSNRAVINWTSFDVGAGNSVSFRQADLGGATLNRVTGTTGSTIAGQITSNGTVYLINPNGIAITSTGRVSTRGGFVASTLDITDSDFNAGRLSFTGRGASGRVSNAGTIVTGSGSYVALLGGSVSNSGTISVPLGKVGLGSGESIALDVNGDGFMQVAVPTSAVTGGNSALIEMAGTIAASGGRVELKAAMVKDAVRNVINLPGSISADNAVGDGGTILLLGGDGGTVRATGTLTARATGAVGNGGLIETSGATVDFTGLTTNAGSANGTTGTWLIDPVNLTVGAAAAATISANLANANVTLQTTSSSATGPGTTSPGNGDIIINSAISWASANTLGLLAFHNIAINAGITGESGGLTLTAGNNVANTGAITATGAVNIGLFNLTNGNWSQTGTTLPAFYASDFRFAVANASFLRATGTDQGTQYRIGDVFGLQGMASRTFLSNAFRLSENIDASGTAAWNDGAGFVPIGDSANPFTGSFDGAGLAIRGLTIYRPTTSAIGLFGASAGTISRVGLIGGLVYGHDNVGGLIGAMNGGTVTNAYTTGSVFSTWGNVGGLIGYAVSADISNVYATGNVAAGTGNAGGLIGLFGGNFLSDAYATGAVSAGLNYAGGLVGFQNSGAIASSYATGAVSSGGLRGGLLGFRFGGTTASSYWDSYSTGSGVAVGGAVGGTSTGLLAVTSDPAQAGAANYAYKAAAYANLTPGSGFPGPSVTGFVFLPGDTTRPFLASEVPILGGLLENSHQLQLIGYNTATLSKNYSLGYDIDLSETGAVVPGDPGSYAGMWAATGFMAIGSVAAPYSGTFDGAGHVLTGLTIKRPTQNAMGLFGYLGGSVSDLGLIGVNITGARYVGGLAGIAADPGGSSGGDVIRSYVTGAVQGTGFVGGLVGIMRANATIGDSWSSANVVASDINAGGLVGSMEDVTKVARAYATGTVTGAGGVGGLVGVSTVTSAGGTPPGGPAPTNITSSYATGKLTNTANAASIGGLIGGYNAATRISNSYWDSYSTGAAFINAARNQIATVVAVTSDPAQSGAANYAYKASAYGNLTAATGIGTATPAGFVYVAGNSTRPFLAFEVPSAAIATTDHAGRLVLENSHQLQLIGSNAATNAANYVLGRPLDLAETGAVTTGAPASYAGMWSSAGFVPIGTDGAGNTWNGSGYATIANISSGIYGFNGSLDGNDFGLTNLFISRTAAKNVGLFGVASGAISNIFVTGRVTGNNGTGGLAGLLYTGGSVTGSASSATVSGNNLIGGLVGNAFDGSSISLSNANGRISGVNDVGGLVGYASGATISRSFAIGQVTGTNYVGGLIGYQYNGTTSNSFSTGSSSASLNTAGGLVGYLYGGSVLNSYAAVPVSAPRGLGGLIGQNVGGTVTSSYWDTSVGGTLISAGGTGYSTAAMRNSATYVGWDFTTIWIAPTSNKYPVLRP